ncbi:MAG TPA: IS110 family transposase [Candidatus Acidoferrum sp.]|nr:IS110 family transposase [Candidatus Acidoferrum sp.]
MKSKLTDFAATLGLDWADQKHDLWIQPADGSKAQHLRLEQTPEAIHEWVAKLRERFGNRPVALAVETSRGPVISALMAYDFIVLFPVNPKALKDYRAAFSVSGAKNDRSDAQLLEQFVRLHRDKLLALEPDTELTRKLAGLVEDRRRLVDERTRLVNQLHSRLKTYYPLAQSLLDSLMNTPLAAEFLARWPDLSSLRRAEPKTLRAFFFKHHSRSAKTIEERLEAIKNAQALTTDPALIEPARLLVGALSQMLRGLHQAIAQFDQAIEQAMNQHPEAALFRSLPGAGPALSPRLLTAFGTNRARFGSAQEVAQFYGLAPVVMQSGTSKTTHMRRRCPKFGRQTFHENAACALRQEPWAHCYYEQQKKRHENKHHQACRALAYKLIRIYFACWRDRQAYQPEKYLRALQTNGSPLHKALETQPQKNCE